MALDAKNLEQGRIEPLLVDSGKKRIVRGV